MLRFFSAGMEDKSHGNDWSISCLFVFSFRTIGLI